MDSPPKEAQEMDSNELEDEFGQKVIKTRELTVLEKEYFDKARKRHKENIYKEQVVQGKTFKGQGFISKPAEINFKDFDLGRTHTIVLQMTNVSFTFNSFKILPLQESIRDFFEIIYTPPGRISAGMSCPVTIRFTPQLNDDIEDRLQLQCETGPLEIKLICTSKKAIARIDQAQLEFGKVIFGEDATQHLKIQNQGALETEVIIKSAKGNDIQTRTETSSQASGKRPKLEGDEDIHALTSQLSQLKFVKVHQLQGYSTLSIPMKYIPTEIGSFDLPLMVYFENFMHSPPITIDIRGECIQVPIYVEKSVYDFQICLFQHIYREKIVFFNRSSNAMKIQIVAPKETKQFFEFNPKLGYIQGNSKFEIWVKFNAERDLVNMCSNYITNDVLEIPFKLIGADQKMPVPFQIRAHMTTASIQINPGRIDFGKIFEGQASRHQITFENLSDLPQELIIYPLPKEISIEMDLLPIRLLPKQKCSTDLIYRSQKLIGFDNDRNDDGYLKCKIVTGTIATKEIRLPYVCEILKCPLEFSALRIDFPALQIDEIHPTTLEIKNLTQRDVIFEFFLPYFEVCGLSMTPMVWQVPRENSFQVNLEYASFFKKLGAFTLQEIKNKYENDASKNFELRLKQRYEEQERKKREEEENRKEEELQKQGKGSKKQDKKEVKKEAKAPQLTKAQQQQLELEQQRQAELEKQKEDEERQRREEFEKSFNVTKELQRLGGKLKEYGNPDDKDYSQHYSWLIPCYFKYCDMPDVAKQVIYLQIDTVSVQKSLILSKTLLDFEEIAVGISTTREIRLTNYSSFPAEMKMEMLPVSCGFTVLNALRTIEPGQYKTLVVQFQPREEQPFSETLKLYCKYGCVSAKLRGKGVRPEVKLSPENGLINIGGVMLGEYAERTFKISNVSNFAIKFQLLSKSSGTQNLNGTEVFSFIPQEAIIPAREELTVKMVFKPDRISDKFYELISIDVPNQKDEKRLFIWGMCYNRQAYINLYSPYTSIPLNIPKIVESPFDILRVKDEDKIFSPSKNRIVLEFSKVKEGEQPSEFAFTRKIVVGSSRLLDNKLEKPTNFDITMPKDEKGAFFSCDLSKGSAAPGSETVVTFTFKPPQIDQFIANIEALQAIGQWKEAKAELKLSGGALRPNVADVWTFEIILRAFVNQI